MGLLILILAIAALIGGIVICNKSDSTSVFEDIGIILTIIGGFSSFILLFGMVIEYTEITQKIEGFKEVQRTIDYARADSQDHENHGITVIIAERNEWLEKKITENETWDLWVPDEILELKPME